MASGYWTQNIPSVRTFHWSPAQTIPENPMGSHKEENLASTSKGHPAEASGGDVVAVPCGGCGSSCLGGNAVPGTDRRRSWGLPVLHDGRGWSGETREGDVSRCLALLSAWRVRKSARVGSGHWGLREPFPDVAKLHHNPRHQRAINTAHLHAHGF